MGCFGGQPIPLQKKGISTMMEKDKLRKADIFSGGLIFLFGLWIVSQAFKMPMKGSWGGVQNVWFVSPALFPLFVGFMIMLLGGILTRTALKTVGGKQFRDVLRWLFSAQLRDFLKLPENIRFYAMAVLFCNYVFIQIARVDFFICSIFFLMVFISQFYFDDDDLIKKLFFFYLAQSAIMGIYFVSGLATVFEKSISDSGDWLALIMALAYAVYAWMQIRDTRQLRKKYRLTIILALAAPFLIGAAFKYLLLVPMPKEGLIVSLMDALRYWDF